MQSQLWERSEKAGGVQKRWAGPKKKKTGNVEVDREGEAQNPPQQSKGTQKQTVSPQ